MVGVGKYSFRHCVNSKNWPVDSCRFFAHGISKYDVFIEIAAVNSSAILTYPRVVRHASFERHFAFQSIFTEIFETSAIISILE